MHAPRVPPSRAWRVVAAMAAAAAALLLPAPAAAQAFGFGAPARLNANAATDIEQDRNPDLATDGAGLWIAVWESRENLGGALGTDSDILLARSTDDGATWSAPAPLNSNAATDSGGDFTPTLLTDGAGTWLVVWQSDDSLGGTIGSDSDIVFARSTDNGTSWTAPAPLNTNAATDGGFDLGPRSATDGAGTWMVVWYSGDTLGGTIGADSDILVARSTDDGTTWSAPAALNTNAPTDLGADFIPRLATDGAGIWVAVWDSSDTLGGTVGFDRDIFIARSTDDGATWTAPAALNTNAATDTGSDINAYITTDGAGNWIAAWQSPDSLGGTIGTDDDILVARSTDGGATWTAPAALNSNAAADTGSDIIPRLTWEGAGNWIASWQSNDTLGGTIGSDYDILVARSTNGGATWTAPAALNSNAATDSGWDQQAVLTTDSAGNWVAVWESQDSLGGTIGTYYDILFATSNSVPVELSGFALD